MPEIGQPTTDLAGSAGTTLPSCYTGQLVPEIGPPTAKSGTTLSVLLLHWALYQTSARNWPPATNIADSAGTTLSNCYTAHWAQIVPEIGPHTTDLAGSGTLTALCLTDKPRKNSCIWGFPLLELSSGPDRSTRVLESFVATDLAVVQGTAR